MLRGSGYLLRIADDPPGESARAGGAGGRAMATDRWPVAASVA